MKKILGCENQILELDTRLKSLKDEKSKIIDLPALTKHVSQDKIEVVGIGKAKRYDRVLSAQYIFERPAEEI